MGNSPKYIIIIVIRFTLLKIFSHTVTLILKYINGTWCDGVFSATDVIATILRVLKYIFHKTILPAIPRRSCTKFKLVS